MAQNEITHRRSQERENIENFSDIISQQYVKNKNLHEYKINEVSK